MSILFVTYLAFEVPSNLVLKKFTPSRWIAFIATAWGLIATLTGLANGYGSLLACRLLLGVVEAGLFPGLKSVPTYSPCFPRLELEKYGTRTDVIWAK